MCWAACRTLGRSIIYAGYTWHLRILCSKLQAPSHIGVILDGERPLADATTDPFKGRFARRPDVAMKILKWAEDLGVGVVTVWLLPVDDCTVGGDELAHTCDRIAELVGRIVAERRWRVRHIGSGELVPDELKDILARAAGATEAIQARTVNLAVGYNGRAEIVRAARKMLASLAERGVSLDQVADEITPESLRRHLFTWDQPDPDLIIRTSGEHRLANFLLWQSEYSEYYFCEATDSQFRRIDFLRAFRSYGQRSRRFGK